MHKALRNTTLFLALALMMLHNIVPHQHHTAMVTDEHCLSSSHQQDDLFDLLSDLFHIDLGDDHLENLRPSETAKDFPNLMVDLAADPLIVIKPVLLLEEKTIAPAQNLPLPKRLSTTPRSLRGPPITIQA